MRHVLLVTLDDVEFAQRQVELANAYSYFGSLYDKYPNL